MSRAYLRLDPGLPDHKGSYPDGAVAAFVFCLCLAEQQPKRGYFKSERLLRVLLERRSRWIRFLLEHEDLVLQADGSLYFDGWHEWQEGDVTVPERMARLRRRKTPAGVTSDTAAGVSSVTGAGVYTPSSGGGGKSNSGGGATVTPPANGGMGWPARKPKPGSHEGQHPHCAVCAPLRPSSPPVDKPVEKSEGGSP